jgi:hypothetical protein
MNWSPTPTIRQAAGLRPVFDVPVFPSFEVCQEREAESRGAHTGRAGGGALPSRTARLLVEGQAAAARGRPRAGPAGALSSCRRPPLRERHHRRRGRRRPGLRARRNHARVGGAAGGASLRMLSLAFGALKAGCAPGFGGVDGPPCIVLTPCLEAETLAPGGVALEPGCRQ